VARYATQERRIMSTKASTAALDRIGQRLLLRLVAHRAIRLAARNCKKGIDAKLGFEWDGKRP
jgi:hypothetical protein